MKIGNIYRDLLNESFNFMGLSDKEKDLMYNIFKDSYEKSLGTYWTKEKFFSRAQNWTFFGDKEGFVAVRPQNSEFYKLVGVAGNIKSIIKGIEELQSKNYPVWGMVSSEIHKMALKKGFKTPPAFLLKLLIKFIPKSVFGNVDFYVNSDGSITLKYSDVGDAKKYFIGNDEYFSKLKKDILPTIKDKIGELPTMMKKGISMFLGEGVEMINEEITSGKVIVYHRTGKNGSPIKGIASDGYRVGTGAYYGVGVYTTYDFDSQLTNYVKQYGNIVIESKVLSLNKFLIFDYDIAKRIYGNKNYTLDNQLSLILGKEWNNYKDNFTLKELIEKIPVVKYTSEIAYDFYQKFSNTIIKKLKGMVFTGSNDGKILVCYDRKNIEPLRYTTDNGKTWKNILNKNIYQRIKGYNTEEENTHITHLLNNIETNNITNSDIDFVEKNLDNLKIKQIIINLNDNGIKYLLGNSSEPDKIINILVDKGKQFIDNLNDNGIYYLLSNSSEPERIINILLSSKQFIDNLNDDGIKYLLTYSSEPERIINILLSSKQFIDNLNGAGIKYLLQNSSEKDKIINILLSSKQFIDNLDKEGIKYLLQNSSEPERIINILLSSKQFIDNLNDTGIYYLLKYSSKPERIINILLSSKQFIDNLNGDGIQYLLQNSSEKDKIINIFLSSKQFIDNLNGDGIKYLLGNSSEPDKIINILGDKGKQFIDNLNDNKIYYLFQYSSEPDKIINILGDKGKQFIDNLNDNKIYYLLQNSSEKDKIINILLSSKQFIDNLNDYGIYYLLKYSSEKDKIINMLLKAGVSKGLINKAIKSLKLDGVDDISLIPETTIGAIFNEIIKEGP